jgi:hypothetical protein
MGAGTGTGFGAAAAGDSGRGAEPGTLDSVTVRARRSWRSASDPRLAQ